MTNDERARGLWPELAPRLENLLIARKYGSDEEAIGLIREALDDADKRAPAKPGGGWLRALRGLKL